MRRLVEYFFKGLEVVLFICMVAMLVMVFGNVVMRYLFNSGFTISDELSRFSFFWVIFLGVIIASRDQTHLSVDTIQQILPKTGRKICWGITQILIFICCFYMFYCFLLQHDIFVDDIAPVSEIPLMCVYDVMYISSAAMALICVYNLVRLLLGQVSEAEYSMQKRTPHKELTESKN